MAFKLSVGAGAERMRFRSFYSLHRNPRKACRIHGCGHSTRAAQGLSEGRACTSI